MVSVYGGGAIIGVDKSRAPYIPLNTTLKDGTAVLVDWMGEGDVDVTHAAFNEMIEDGTAWPFDETFSRERYVGYYMSHAAFCVRDAGSKEVLGFFYVKPNFPGRCSHVCNGGFITMARHRRRGVARVMGQTYLRVAPDLGYKMSCFNLVFDNNPSLTLWESLGFQRAGRIPNAADLKGCDELVDAHVMVYDFSKRAEQAPAD